MNRALVVLCVAGVFELAGCRLGDRGEPEAEPAGAGTETVRSAVKVADAAGLAHPEYDLDVGSDFFGIGSRPGEEISAKMLDGFRLISVSAALPTLFNATFIRNDDPLSPYYRVGNSWAWGLSETQLLDIYANANVRIVDIATYLEGGDRTYAAVWLDNTDPQHVDYKLVLHTTPADFQAQMQPTSPPDLGWRVIDVETQPVPGDEGKYEVSGVAIKNMDAASTRQQWFGYGPLAGNTVVPPADATQVQTWSLGKGIADNQARTADLSSPFGDGNFFWVAEATLDNPRPESLADPDCTKVVDQSTERNWWFADLKIESSSDDEGKEEFVSHSLTRFGGRPGKLKSYKAALAGNAVRYAGVIYDNGPPPIQGTPDSTNNVVLQKVDAAFINRMKRWGLPGGALALVRNGQLIYARGFGFSDLSNDHPRLAQPDDLFRLASVSKPINESMLLRLLNDDKNTKPVHTIGGGAVTLDTHPFGEIFEYEPPLVAGDCDVDGLAGTNDTSGCHLGHIRLRDLLFHRSGLQNIGNAGTPDIPQNFSYDIPSAHDPKAWTDRELYWRCLTMVPDPPLICVRPGPFVKPPGVLFTYMNAEYQIVLAVVEKLSGMSYEAYLAEVLAPLQLDKIRPARFSELPDLPGFPQAIPYTIPLPACNAVPEGTRSADYNVFPVPPPIDDGRTTHNYMGSASIAASMIDLVRWGTSINGSRGGYRIFSGSPVADDVFNLDFRGGDPGCLACAVPGDTTGYPFEHGGLFNFDAQARTRMLANGITWAFAVNGTSLNCNQQNTHAFPMDGSFDGELRDDLESIFAVAPGKAGCSTFLPDVDHFSSYKPNEAHALCQDVSATAGPSCTATVTAAQIGAGSTGGVPTLTTGGTFGPGSHPVGIAVGNNTLGFSRCSATFAVTDGTPPTVVAPAALTATVCFGGGTVTIGQATATDNCATNLQPTGLVTSKNGISLSPPIPVIGGQASLTPGLYIVQWTVSDGIFTRSASQTVTVAPDATVPVVTAPATFSQKICQTRAVINVGQATATDNCPVTVTGQVVTSNGVTLPSPITITGGQVDLGLGTHTIRWTASDGFNTSPAAIRFVTVSPTIESSLSYDVQDRAQIRLPGGGFAAVLSAGTGTTHIGQDARTGAILSVGSVTIQHRAIVDGTVTSAGTITKDTDATAGTQTQGASVFLPALPTLPAFPPATGGTFTVNSGTRNQAPGSFTSVSVNGGTLVLAAGDYFFQSLTMNANGTVRVAPTTRVFVRDNIGFLTPFRASSGTAIQAIFFGFAGSNLSLPIRFDGTLVAPNATVSFGSGPGVTYTGSFYGRRLQVNPASALVCSP